MHSEEEYGFKLLYDFQISEQHYGELKNGIERACLTALDQVKKYNKPVPQVFIRGIADHWYATVFVREYNGERQAFFGIYDKETNSILTRCLSSDIDGFDFVAFIDRIGNLCKNDLNRDVYNMDNIKNVWQKQVTLQDNFLAAKREHNEYDIER